jgi:hypothetical protein
MWNVNRSYSARRLGGLALTWNQKDLVVVFLNRLPSCLRAGDTIVAKVCKALGKGFPIVQVADALSIRGAIFHYNRNPHLMLAATFVARNEDPVLGS